MPVSQDSRSRSVHGMAPHRWRSARILEAVCQINEHLVSALTELARHGDVSATIVAENVKVLCHLDVAACKRAARIPILLLDLHFQSEDWWRDAVRLNGKLHQSQQVRVACLPIKSPNLHARLSLLPGSRLTTLDRARTYCSVCPVQ